jgi:hypothetical protein
VIITRVRTPRLAIVRSGPRRARALPAFLLRRHVRATGTGVARGSQVNANAVGSDNRRGGSTGPIRAPVPPNRVPAGRVRTPTRRTKPLNRDRRNSTPEPSETGTVHRCRIPHSVFAPVAAPAERHEVLRAGWCPRPGEGPRQPQQRGVWRETAWATLRFRRTTSALFRALTSAFCGSASGKPKCCVSHHTTRGTQHGALRCSELV